MTARQFADSPFLASAGERLERFYQYLRQLPLGVWRNLVIVLSLFWICHSLATLFWVAVPVPDVPQPPSFAQPLVEDSGGSTVNIDVAGIQDLNMFGNATEEVAVVEDQPQQVTLPGIEDQAVTTSLSLKLQGVISSTNQDEARAVIADGNSQSLYSIGEKLPQGNNVKLAKIMPQRVILDNNGRYESLWLYSEEDFKGSGSFTSYREPIENQYRGIPAPVEQEAPQEIVEEPEPITTTVNPEQIPRSINDVVRFSVYREDGQMIGYRVRPGRERELFDQVGLQTNDVVTSVNGIAVDDPRQVRAIYQELKTATSAQLTVLRDGQSIPISISLDTGG